jgi:arylsulfatase A-like enzyme
MFRAFIWSSRQVLVCWSACYSQTLTAIVAVALFLAASSDAQEKRTSSINSDAINRPNVVIILADDLGWGSVGCYGADPSMIRTPNIDRLAREGRQFTDASCPSSVCTPTRYGLLTGRYCWRTSLKQGTLSPTDPLLLDVDRVNLASLLKQKGYATAAIGKWHLGYGVKQSEFTGALRPGPLQLGFDYHFGVPQNHGDFIGAYVENEAVFGLRSSKLQPTDAKNDNGKPLMGLDAPQRVYEETTQTLTDHAVEWINRQDPAKPFFLYFTPVAVHAPVTPSSDLQGSSSVGPFGDWIHDLDRSVGQLLDVLDRRRMAENTVVLFTSDNGGVNEPTQKRPESVAIERGLRPNGPLRHGKTSVYEGGFRVPYLVRWPGHVPPNSRSNEMISLVDTLATVAAMLDTPLPSLELAAGDSFDVLPAWLDQPHEPLRSSMITHSNDGTFAVRQGPWKYIEGKPAEPPKNGKKPQPQLYHLSDDLGETQDLIKQQPEVAAQLQQLLDESRRNSGTRRREP